MLLEIAAIAAIGAVALTPSAAFAHAELVSSNPAGDATLQVMPVQVSLTMNEPVQMPSFVEVTSSDGTRINSYKVTVEGDTVTTAITQSAPAGAYRMSYEIVSADEHPISGTINFSVVEGAAPAPTPANTEPPPAEPRVGPTAEAAAGEPQITPASDGSTTTQDVLTILGFFIVTMTGFVLVLRAGLKSAATEDED
ncbi:copper resistance CopC family protein [Aeromicrobium stalagmiti]|uniref:copper resistance CopC family protein n=1 Tax=Aeromicrobium stalagmiti TaxID=2738988 RepID=UPI001C2BD453|nr:copper resistance CopC family protein [Aeromicrobium stalagmiti]NRQ51752.1 copper resistance protein CopC [Aeromicrobium stalagmiti]